MIKEESFLLREKKVPNLSFAGLYGLGFCFEVFRVLFNLLCFQFQSLFLSLSFI